ncbi:S24 family peptidase [Deinococcus radiomollis]|uniref:helix-turn-helix domain-containing protein n=1 Tax=Deinococcus radiomollis TaxID=468916 RepID=UPI0038924E1D
MTLTVASYWTPPMPISRPRLAEWLAETRQRLGLGQDEVDRRTRELGARVSQSYLSQIERGTKSLEDMGGSRMEALRQVYKLTPEQWAKETGLSIVSPDTLPSYIPSTVREIPEVILMPVYSLATAGIPMQDATPLDYDPIAMPRDQWHPALQLFLAEGESMSDGQEDSIRSGDILHVDMRATDPHDGRVMVVQITGQGVTVKRVRLLGENYWLFSDNPDQKKYPPFQADEAKILGIVQELTRKVKVRLS